MRSEREILEMADRCWCREECNFDDRGEHEVETIVEDANGDEWVLFTTYDYDYDLREVLGTCWEGYDWETWEERCNEECELQEAVLIDPDGNDHDVYDFLVQKVEKTY